ncbi:MAG: PEP-CTERM sorting domain-containing protein, partial [candidate division Zixibacteria bacterium]|nr:PEP-CTERM sorting domain-containing protein [candidate division Zixibacteria bacterium]
MIQDFYFSEYGHLSNFLTNSWCIDNINVNTRGYRHAEIIQQVPGCFCGSRISLLYRSNEFTGQIVATPKVPEPSSIALAVLALLGVAAFGWRRRKGEANARPPQSGTRQVARRQTQV